MKSAPPIVISASRRTDIPAFYMDWFMERIEKGYFEIVNPYNGRVSTITAIPEAVHTIVFWSKNFGPFINRQYGRVLRKKGYHLFFNFTINSQNLLLEPGIPPLKERLRQLDTLCRHFGAECVNWRFDPICFYRNRDRRINDNLGDFRQIARRAAQNGVQRCITSFMDDYAKIRKRTARMPQFVFIDPDNESKIDVILKMETFLKEKNIRLRTCCEKSLLDALPEGSTVKGSRCVPNERLIELFGGELSVKADKGQRIKAGCGCRESVDIGSYRHHPCYHNCLFCYANPAAAGAGSD
jgi:hypothetical protein